MTIPKGTVTPVGVEIQWTCTLNPSLFADTKFKVFVVKPTRIAGSVDEMLSVPRTTQSPTGSASLTVLQPDTTYYAALAISYPGMHAAVIVKTDLFKTRGVI